MRQASSRTAISVQRVPLHQEAADRVRQLIIYGVLAPGTHVAEGELSEMLGVSRTPLREALKILASQGLVELMQNRGARVTPLRANEVFELFETMAGVERVAAELAAHRATAEDLAALADLQDKMERHHTAGELEPYFNLNQQTHGLIVRMSKNSVLVETHDWLTARVERARYLALRSRGRWDESLSEHASILQALQRRDAAEAGRLMAEHVLRTGAIVSRAVSAVPSLDHKG